MDSKIRTRNTTEVNGTRLHLDSLATQINGLEVYRRKITDLLRERAHTDDEVSDDKRVTIHCTRKGNGNICLRFRDFMLNNVRRDRL